MRKGFPTRILYDNFFPNFENYLPDEIIANKPKLAELLLLAIGCNSTDFKCGATQVFFRSGKSVLFHQLNMLDTTVVRDLASKIESRMKKQIHQMASHQIEEINCEQILDDGILQNDLDRTDEKCESIPPIVVCKQEKCVLKKSTNEYDEEPSTSHNARYDEIRHWPYHDDKNSASRCKLPKCKNLTHVFCEKCQKHLCFTSKRNCFVAYHGV